MPTPALPQPLSLLVQALRDAGYDSATLTYRRLWEDAMRGLFPVQRQRGRWYFLPADLPRIATVYELPRATPSRGRRAPAATTATAA
jgi:hypothetical protein